MKILNVCEILGKAKPKQRNTQKTEPVELNMPLPRARLFEPSRAPRPHRFSYRSFVRRSLHLDLSAGCVQLYLICVWRSCGLVVVLASLYPSHARARITREVACWRSKTVRPSCTAGLRSFSDVLGVVFGVARKDALHGAEEALKRQLVEEDALAVGLGLDGGGTAAAFAMQ